MKYGLMGFVMATLVVSPLWALDTIVVQRKSLPDYLTLDGVVDAVQQSTVSAQTSGRVNRIFFDVDDAVTPGAVIIELDAAEQQARFAQANSAFKETQAGLADAKQNFTRIESVFKRGLASQAQFDQAQNQLNAAQARFERAKAGADEAQQQLDYTNIIAPFAGIVTQRHVEIGESVNPGQPLMSGLSLEQLRVITFVPQTYAQSLREHGEVSITLPSGHALATKAITVFPYAEPTSHAFKVRIDLAAAEDALYPGMFVKVAIPIAQKTGLFIPASALVQRGELRALYVMNQANQPRLRQVRVGQVIAGEIEILAGLHDGDLVVMNPAAALAQLEE